MSMPERCLMMRAYIGEGYTSPHGHNPIYQEIVWEAKRAQLGGATVTKGPIGLGHIGTIHDKDNSRHSDDLPVVVEIIDSPEKIMAFVPHAAKLMGNHGLIVTHDVTVHHQGHPNAVPRAEGVTPSN